MNVIIRTVPWRPWEKTRSGVNAASWKNGRGLFARGTSNKNLGWWRLDFFQCGENQESLRNRGLMSKKWLLSNCLCFAKCKMFPPKIFPSNQVTLPSLPLVESVLSGSITQPHHQQLGQTVDIYALRETSHLQTFFHSQKSRKSEPAYTSQSCQSSSKKHPHSPWETVENPEKAPRATGSLEDWVKLPVITGEAGWFC